MVKHCRQHCTRYIHWGLWVLLGVVLLIALVQGLTWWQTGRAVVAGQRPPAAPRVLIPTHRLPSIVHPTPPTTPPPTPVPTPVTSPTPRPTATPTPPSPPPFVVRAAREHGIDTRGRYIVVDQAHQRMYIVEGNALVRVLPVSTGDPQRGFFTPAWVGRVGVYWGTFSAHGVYADHAWHLFRAPGGNILIHGLPYTLDARGRKIYQDADALGKTPASRGCIRLRPDDAAWFTRWGPAGVPIVILPHPASQGKGTP